MGNWKFSSRMRVRRALPTLNGPLTRATKSAARSFESDLSLFAMVAPEPSDYALPPPLRLTHRSTVKSHRSTSSCSGHSCGEQEWRHDSFERTEPRSPNGGLEGRTGGTNVQTRAVASVASWPRTRSDGDRLRSIHCCRSSGMRFKGRYQVEQPLGAPDRGRLVGQSQRRCTDWNTSAMHRLRGADRDSAGERQLHASPSGVLDLIGLSCGIPVGQQFWANLLATTEPRTPRCSTENATLLPAAKTMG
jgi:hypothetical protein